MIDLIKSWEGIMISKVRKKSDFSSTMIHTFWAEELKGLKGLKT